ncbi:hypothetical protein M9H77_16755 [Catharanthus roseus]|uniref:Uncharacterized protein n=1 Tax=Catharanthus roseus TaxID=4058 RepID=A0ACC0B2N5_CATRO|nr:hypothetical protein M9H77_16755 [Catharanthus roseus]
MATQQKQLKQNPKQHTTAAASAAEVEIPTRRSCRISASHNISLAAAQCCLGLRISFFADRINSAPFSWLPAQLGPMAVKKKGIYLYSLEVVIVNRSKKLYQITEITKTFHFSSMAPATWQKIPDLRELLSSSDPASEVLSSSDPASEVLLDFLYFLSVIISVARFLFFLLYSCGGGGHSEPSLESSKEPETNEELVMPSSSIPDPPSILETYDSELEGSDEKEEHPEAQAQALTDCQLL